MQTSKNPADQRREASNVVDAAAADAAIKQIAAQINNDKVVMLGSQRVNVLAVLQKVNEDISFLNARINTIEKMKTPNSVMLSTYREMLLSRESVRDWLSLQ
ncbi:hypothetical protein [Teredinibacter waterburyi]|jgi:hypothetical protein|uniref:hypothetical protein n=1 Tax=Teredinibacter waterburyi TaxID=1500538 RepID=UPI00165F2283|nr:hypothetical protein [Teredinibacter waterburyi]